MASDGNRTGPGMEEDPGYVPEIYYVPQATPCSDEEDGFIDAQSPQLCPQLPPGQFVEVASLQLEDLPAPIRSPITLETIRSVARRVVRVVVNKASAARQGHFLDKVQPGSFMGTGFAVFIHHHFVIVATNRHVIFDDEEARNSTIQFFFDSNATRDEWREFVGIGVIRARSGRDFSLVVYWLHSASKETMHSPHSVRQHKDLKPYCFPHLAYSRTSCTNTPVVSGCVHTSLSEELSSRSQNDSGNPEPNNPPVDGVSTGTTATLATPTATSSTTTISTTPATTQTTLDAVSVPADVSLTTRHPCGEEVTETDGKTYVCVIAHPDDLTKHVSFGEILSEDHKTREFRHNAPTSSGSSGAPILVFFPGQIDAPPNSIWYHCGQLAPPSEVRVARLQVNNAQLFTTEFNRELAGWKMLGDLLPSLANVESHLPTGNSGEGAPGCRRPIQESQGPSVVSQSPSSVPPSLLMATRLLLWAFLSGQALLQKDLRGVISSEREPDAPPLIEAFRDLGNLLFKLLDDDTIDEQCHPISFFTVAKALLDLHAACLHHRPCFCTALKSSGIPGDPAELQRLCHLSLSPQTVLQPSSMPAPGQKLSSPGINGTSQPRAEAQQASDSGPTQPFSHPSGASEAPQAAQQWPDGCVLMATVKLLTSYLSKPGVTILGSLPELNLLLRIAIQVARLMTLGGVLARDRMEQAESGRQGTPSLDASLLSDFMAVIADSYGSFLAIYDPWRQVAVESNMKALGGGSRTSSAGEEARPGSRNEVEESLAHLLLHESQERVSSGFECKRPNSHCLQEDMEVLLEEMLGQWSRFSSQTLGKNPDFEQAVENTKTMAAMTVIVGTLSCMPHDMPITHCRQMFSRRLQQALNGTDAAMVRTVIQNLEQILHTAHSILGLAKEAWNSVNQTRDTDSSKTLLATREHRQGNAGATVFRNDLTPAAQAMGTEAKEHQSPGHSDVTQGLQTPEQSDVAQRLPSAGHGDDTPRMMRPVQENESVDCWRRQDQLPRNVPEHEVFCYLCWWGKRHLIRNKEQTADYWKLQKRMYRESGGSLPGWKVLMDWRSTLQLWMANIAVDVIRREDERFRDDQAGQRLFKLINRHGRRIFLAGFHQLMTSSDPVHVPSLDDAMKESPQEEGIMGDARRERADTPPEGHTPAGSTSQRPSFLDLQEVTSSYRKVLEHLKTPENLDELERLLKSLHV